MDHKRSIGSCWELKKEENMPEVPNTPIRTKTLLNISNFYPVPQHHTGRHSFKANPAGLMLWLIGHNYWIISWPTLRICMLDTYWCLLIFHGCKYVPCVPLILCWLGISRKQLITCSTLILGLEWYMNSISNFSIFLELFLRRWDVCFITSQLLPVV